MCPLLRRFLLDRGLYWKFHFEVFRAADSVKAYIKARDFLSVSNPNTIASAFDWIDSFYGCNFWASVDRKWGINYNMMKFAENNSRNNA